MALATPRASSLVRYSGIISQVLGVSVTCQGAVMGMVRWCEGEAKKITACGINAIKVAPPSALALEQVFELFIGGLSWAGPCPS